MTEIKLKILEAGEKIMSQKRVKASSISEIAAAAGVKDPVIYRFFDSKEDLLFSIPGRRMEDVLKDLLEQLEGIRDPISKLSKMIWFHLFFNDSHRGYAKLLLLECRSNRNFYQHEAYQLIRKYAGVLLGILMDGVEKNIFRSDVDMRLVRDIIFGVLDWETLTCLAAGEIQETVSDLEDIMSIVLPMIQKSARSSEPADKAQIILSSAEATFATKGYAGATISEIAKLANVSEGTIYDYFYNKEHLLFSIAQQRFKTHLNALEQVFEIKSPVRKFRRLIRYHFSLYLTERNFVQVFLLLIQLNERFYASDVFTDFYNYTQLLVRTLKEGKEEGSIRRDLNTRVFRNLFFGTFSHMALRWLILEKGAESDKMREIDEIVTLFTQAVVTEKGESPMTF